jgi:hypothetical protein
MDFLALFRSSFIEYLIRLMKDGALSAWNTIQEDV